MHLQHEQGYCTECCFANSHNSQLCDRKRLLWEFSSDERSVGKCEVWHFCFAQTAIIIFVFFSSIVIENRFKESKKRKQNFNSKRTRRKCRLFSWALPPQSRALLFLPISSFCPSRCMRLLSVTVTPDRDVPAIHLNESTACKKPALQMWLRDAEAVERFSFLHDGQTRFLPVEMLSLLPWGYIYSIYLFHCNTRVTSVCQTQRPGAKSQCLGKNIRTKWCFLSCSPNTFVIKLQLSKKKKKSFCFKNKDNFSHFPNKPPQCKQLLFHCEWGCEWKVQAEGRRTAPGLTAAAWPKFCASALFVRQPMLLLILLNSEYILHIR